MVEDIANLIPLVEDKEGVFNICDTESPSFKDLETLIAKQLNKKPPMNIPYWFAKILAICGDILGRKAPINSKRLRKITETQTFSNKKAITELSFQPLNVLQHFKI
ncbi:MAG: NAD(P)-dependent oxidoreductase, partial [Bacteroidales bacterium]|nr:NAD(P)-dependent oxidoreductase [Bacteroidales bacterium]